MLNGHQDLTNEPTNQHLQHPLLTHTSKPITPYADCSLFSHLTFSWLTPLISLGRKKPLDLNDIPDLSGPDSADGSFPILKNKLDRDRAVNNKLTTLNLVTALIITTWKDILTTAILAVLYTLASYVGPYLIDAFVQFLNGSQESKLNGYLFVLIFFLAKVVESVSQRHWFFKLQQGGIRARAALVAMIYQKGLTISSRSTAGQSVGEITNLIAIDAERIGDFGWYIHDPWLVILQVGIALIILYHNLGIASLSALVAIGIVMLINLPLNLDELDSGQVESSPRGSSDVAVEVIDGSFSWDFLSGNLSLKNINIKVFHGMKVAVCGTVGSGKSSLLSCVLGEVSKVRGSVKVNGTKAYVAQSAWIQSGIIEENIVFGEDMDRERYEKVLKACDLEKDLEILPFGDQTVIGERGINLSGGQKQRLQIARALYQDAEIYLFDDPFSAVDAHTGSHLCINSA